MMNKKLLLTGLFLSNFFSGIEHTIIATAMPDIVKDLNGVHLFTWATVAYTLASISILPIAGKMADMFEKRTIYLIGMLVFMIGSLFSGTAHSMPQLIIFRAIQGVGTGMFSPMTSVIVGYLFDVKERTKLQGYFSIIYGGSTVVGPVIGGLLTELISWRWIFYINIPVGILTCMFIYIGLKNTEKIKISLHKKVDIIGSFLIAGLLVSSLLFISFVNVKFEFYSLDSFVYIMISFILFIVFVIHELRYVNPVFDLRLFRSSFFSISNILSFLSGFSKFGAITFVPLFLQIVLMYDSTKAGTTLTPLLFGMIVSNYISGKFLLRYPYRFVVMIGCLFSFFGYLFLSFIDSSTTYLFSWVSMCFLGIGIGAIGLPLTIVSQSIYPKEKIGVVTSSITLSRWCGGIVGVTVINSLMTNLFLNKIYSNYHFLKKFNLDQIYQKLIERDLSKETLFNLQTLWLSSIHFIFIFIMILLAVSVVLSVFLGKVDINKTQKNIKS